MKVTIVAEIASNWEGNVTKAKKLIKECKKAGADGVKFQAWRAIDLYDEKHPNWREIKKSELTFENMYMIASPLYTLFNDKNIKESYQGIKKIEDVQKYSSDSVEKISVKDLKTIIENAGLLN